MRRLIAGVISWSLIWIIVITFSQAAPTISTPPSEQDLITACKVLKQTTADSNPKTEREKIVIYRNAYVLLRKRIKSEGVLTEEDKYFNDLQNLNARADYPVVISISSSPRGSKGWTHNEVGEYMTLTEKGLRIQDIEALIKLKHEVDEIQLPDTPSVMVSPALIKLKKAVDKIKFPIKPSVPGNPPVVKPPVQGNPTVDRP